MTKSQLATIAIDAEPIWRAIQENVEAERRRKISEARVRQEAERKEKGRIEGAERVKETNPEQFEAVKIRR